MGRGGGWRGGGTGRFLEGFGWVVGWSFLVVVVVVHVWGWWSLWEDMDGWMKFGLAGRSGGGEGGCGIGWCYVLTSGMVLTIFCMIYYAWPDLSHLFCLSMCVYKTVRSKGTRPTVLRQPSASSTQAEA